MNNCFILQYISPNRAVIAKEKRDAKKKERAEKKAAEKEAAKANGDVSKDAEAKETAESKGLG